MINNKQIATSGGLDYGYKNWMTWFSGTAHRTGDYGGRRFRYGRKYGHTTWIWRWRFWLIWRKGFFRANYSYQELIGIPLDDEEDPEKKKIRSYRSNYR